MEKKTNKQINGWKWAFLLLFGLLLGTGIFLYSRVTAVWEPETNLPAVVSTSKQTPIFTVDTHKKQINQIITHYLKDYQKKSKIKYEFYLEKNALLKGEAKVLGVPLNFYLYFDPYVLENGNIQLKTKSISIGKLGVPIPEVLSYVDKNYTFPKWVNINPKKKTITLRLDQLELTDGIQIKAEKMDLINDEITFALYLTKK